MPVTELAAAKGQTDMHAASKQDTILRTSTSEAHCLVYYTVQAPELNAGTTRQSDWHARALGRTDNTPRVGCQLLQQDMALWNLSNVVHIAVLCKTLQHASAETSV
jgi:hypothetical protein